MINFVPVDDTNFDGFWSHHPSIFNIENKARFWDEEPNFKVDDFSLCTLRDFENEDVSGGTQTHNLRNSLH